MQLDTVLANFLKTPPYYPCLLLVHPEIHRLRSAMDDLVSRYGWPGVPVSTRLAEALLRVPYADRPRNVSQILRNVAEGIDAEVLLFHEIDLLFEPSLAVDPLAILRSISRIRPLVVTWPGSFDGGMLSYAVPEHAHYRTWSKPDLCSYCIQPI